MSFFCLNFEVNFARKVMYIVNTTFVVEPLAQDKWLELIRRDYIPFLLKNGFSDIVFTRIVSTEAVDHFTYSLQVGASDIPSYQRLTSELFAEYLTIAEPLFSTQVMWFTSLMKKVDLN